MSAIVVSDSTTPVSNVIGTSSHEDPFRIGWRNVVRTLPDGTTEGVQIPLTAEDCLHPQPEDVIVENTLHSRIRTYLDYVLAKHFENDPHVLVLSDTGVYWDDPALEHHSPDIAVIFDVREQRERWDSFFVAEQGTRPRLVIEIVSPNTRDNDVVKKVREYHLARVDYYVIVDFQDNKVRLIGYQSMPSKYVTIPSEKTGRIWLEPMGL